MDAGNTVLVIDTASMSPQMADHASSTRPRGREGGGRIIGLWHVVKVKESYTGRYLAPILKADHEAHGECGESGPT